MITFIPKHNRNKHILGKNSKSYDDKHPERPIQLRPIHTAIRAGRETPKKHLLRFIGTLSKPDIADWAADKWQAI